MKGGRLLGVALALAALAGCTTASSTPAAPQVATAPAPAAANALAAPKPAAPAPQVTRPPLVVERALDIDGTPRTYRLAVPQPLTAGLPLLVVLHGRRIDGEYEARRTGFDQLAERGEAVVAYPNGLEGSWNAGTCCDRSARKRIDDVGLVRAVIPDVQQAAQTDPARTYLTGFSVGGMLAFTIACQTPEIIAAIAVVSAVPVAECPANDPVAVAQIHGLADESVPYAGTSLSPVLGIPLLAVPDVVDAFRSRNGCTAAVQQRVNGAADTRRWSQCTTGGAVQLTTIKDQPHDYPQSASTEIWAFVKDFRRAR